MDDPLNDAVDIKDIEDVDESGGDDTLNPATPSYTTDEHSMSGTTPAPQSDDNVLDASHQVGLRMDETEEEKKELDIAADVAAAEKARRSPPDDQDED